MNATNVNPVTADLSINQLIAGLQAGQWSPTELAQACIDRIASVEGACRAWVSFSPEILLEQARNAEKRLAEGAPIRALEGIPFGVKDIFNTSQFPTQMGSPLWKGFTPGNDARAVFHLQRAGGLVAGKTETAEFAVHALNNTLNPHHPERTPGTSSSGSAVAVAAGMVPAALGTQTAGSIVRPASFCGVYGVKPSFGLIPRTGMLKTTDSLDTIGYFVQHQEDMRRVFDVLRVHGPDYPLSHAALSDPARQTKPKDRPWKVAFVRPHVWPLAADYAQHAMLGWVNRLAARGDVEVIEVELPAEIATAHAVHTTIYDRSLAYYFKEEAQRQELLSPVMREIMQRGNRVTPEAFHRALADQEHLARVMDHFLKDFDVMITLSTAGEAPRREATETDDSALIWSLAHLPVVSAPVFIAPSGLPFGAQVVARRYNDLLLFDFMDALAASGDVPLQSFPRLTFDLASVV